MQLRRDDPPTAAVAPDPDLEPTLAAARAGDDAAFAALYRRFVGVVHGIALARVGPSDADDVVQEAFVAVHRGLASVRDAAAFPGWVCAVARNAATDRARRKARAPVTAPLHDHAARPVTHDDGDARRAHALAALQALPEAYRETLVFRLVEGLTGPEIAARTGLTPGSVRVNLCKGLAMLRARLAEDGTR